MSKNWTKRSKVFCSIQTSPATATATATTKAVTVDTCLQQLPKVSVYPEGLEHRVVSQAYIVEITTDKHTVRSNILPINYNRRMYNFEALQRFYELSYSNNYLCEYHMKLSQYIEVYFKLSQQAGNS